MANQDLSWLFPLSGAVAGGYGDQSQAIIQRLLSEDPSRQAIYDKIEPKLGTTMGYNEGGEFLKQETGELDWSQVPRPGPAGFEVPKNYAWAPANSNYRVDPYTQKPVAPKGPVYQDAAFGPLELVQQRAPDDLQMKIGRALVLSLVGGGIAGALAPAVGGALGLGQSATPWISRILSMLPKAATYGR